MTFVPQSTNHILPQWRGNSFTQSNELDTLRKNSQSWLENLPFMFFLLFRKGWSLGQLRWFNEDLGFPKMMVPNNHRFSLLKMIIWGVLGVPPFKETPIYPYQNQISCWIIWPLLCHSSCYRFCSSCSGGGGGTSILHSIVGTSVSNAVHTHTIHGTGNICLHFVDFYGKCR